MRNCFTFIALCVALCLHAQKPNPIYDSTLAKKLQGNDNGMKRFILVLLKTGSNTSASKSMQDSLFAGHMKNITRLADAGELLIAGPLGKNEKYRGIFVLNTESMEKAGGMLAADPAIKEKLLEPELYQFWSSAALQELPLIHKKITKNN